MSEQHYRLPPFQIILAESNSKVPEKIQVMKVGTFDHPQYGKFTITPNDLLKFKENFDNKIRGVDLSLDYGHQSDKEAAAWFKSLELGDDGQSLWALMDWTPTGEQSVLKKEYRYISPDLNFDWKNPETNKSCGPTLFGAALTNRPFLKNMQAVIELSEQNPNGKEIKMDPKDQKIAELEQQLAAMKSQMEASGLECADLKKKLGDFAQKEQVAVEEKKMAEKKTKFETMLSEGKVVKAQEEAFMKDDFAKFTELAQPLKLSETGHGAPGEKTKEVTDAEVQVIALADKKIEEKKAKTQGEAISMVLSENPELRKQYESKFNV